MTTRRTAKSKGNQFEYDCHASLKPIYPDLLLTKQLGFQMQCDLFDDHSSTVFECKRLKSLSWNQAKKYLEKLEELYPEHITYLLFKSNLKNVCKTIY